MERKAVLGIMLALLLTSMLILTFNIHQVEASGTIYIRPDGSVDPDTAPISTVDNVTYTITDNINESIVVERDNIVVDGTGYTLQGIEDGEGITITNRTNVTIKNVEIKGFNFGISLIESSNNSISKNDVRAHNINGITLSKSSNNIIFGNNVTYNYFGIYFYSSFDNVVYHNNFVNNTNQFDLVLGSVIAWDNGAEGNYWSDYEENHPDAKELNASGIWDTPYVIDDYNQDRYPLMNPTWGPIPTAMEVPFWMQWWFWTTIAIVVVASAGALYFLKKRKAPIVPTPPAEGTV